MENNYPKAYKEVVEVLKFIPEESVKKIPQAVIDTFKARMDNDYNFKVDTNKSFEEQNLLEETKAIFANIFRDYWATPYQKERIKAKEKYDRQIIEEEKKKRYSMEDIFKNKEKIKHNKYVSLNENNDFERNLPVEIKAEKFYYKLIEFIKKIFKVKKDKI